MIKRTGLTEEQSANSFSDEDLVGMVCGNNPQANAYRELLASRQSLLDCKQRIQQLLAERNSTGLAIDKAILSGIVPEQHPLRSRLELLANHHKREQALAELLRRARRYVSPLSCPESEIQIVQSIVSSIDSVLAGQLPELTSLPDCTEVTRTAPERIWLQVGDQASDGDYQFPEHMTR